jgi:hypothetical protein
MVGEILSAPNESFEDHIFKVLGIWNKICDKVTLNVARLTNMRPEDVDILVRSMIVSHDVGKLTSLWQRRVRLEQGSRIPHASLGATCLWKHLESWGDIRYAPTFAVNIHHIDRGIIGENTERPHVQLIRSGLVDYRGKVKWADGAEETFSNVGADAGVKTLSLSEVTLLDCEKMAEGTRVWSRGVSTLERHRRRLMASSFHHVLKICDIRAAANREDLKVREHSQLVSKILEGGLF